MRINPIIPIWVMAVISVILLLLKRKGVAAYIRQIVIVALVFLINLRIAIPDGTVTKRNQTMEARVIFVVDNTISMLARDYDGDNERMEGVRKDCETITKELFGAKCQVISFDNDAKLLCPATTDTNYVKSVIDNMYPPESYYARGTSLNTAKKMLISTAKYAAEKKDGKVFVFFISDGEITDGSKLESFKDAAKYVDGGAVLGYGTTDGGIMYRKNTYGNGEELINDPNTYQAAVSKIDENNLKAIADDIGIDYVNMNEGSIDGILNDIKKDAQKHSEEVEEKGYQDIYYFLAIPLLLLLVYEIICLRRR